MNKLHLAPFKVGMIVITPCSNLPYITEDDYYTILDVEGDWLQIKDDTEEVRYYRSHLFIEANIYYNTIMWLTTVRLFDLKPD